jgi:hypothetical protein
MKIAEKVKEFFHNEGIHSTTIQPEFVEMNEVRVLSRHSDFSSVLLYVLSVPQIDDKFSSHWGSSYSYKA